MSNFLTKRGSRYHNLSELVFGLMYGVQSESISVELANKIMDAAIAKDYSSLTEEEWKLAGRIMMRCIPMKQKWFTKEHINPRKWKADLREY